jgi:hypothetical protein
MYEHPLLLWHMRISDVYQLALLARLEIIAVR